MLLSFLVNVISVSLLPSSEVGLKFSTRYESLSFPAPQQLLGFSSLSSNSGAKQGSGSDISWSIGRSALCYNYGPGGRPVCISDALISFPVLLFSSIFLFPFGLCRGVIFLPSKSLNWQNIHLIEWKHSIKCVTKTLARLTLVVCLKGHNFYF